MTETMREIDESKVEAKMRWGYTGHVGTLLANYSGPFCLIDWLETIQMERNFDIMVLIVNRLNS